MIVTRRLFTGLALLVLALPARTMDIDVRLPGNRFMEIRLPQAGGSTQEIAAGPDGHVWAAQVDTAQLVRVTRIGETRRFALPKGSVPRGMVFDRAGKLWVALEARHTLAQFDIKTGRVLKEYPLTTADQRDIAPHGLCLAQDGKSLWFAAKAANAIGKFNPENGEVTLVPLPNPDTRPHQVSADREGNVWYIAPEGGVVGFVNADGFIFEFPIPEGSGRPQTIVPDPVEARMWFSLEAGGMFASIDTVGNMSVHSMAKADTQLAGLGFDGHGRLWLVARSPDLVARVDKNMSVTEWPLPTLRAGLYRITRGADGNMWFSESAADKVGYVVDTPDYGK